MAKEGNDQYRPAQTHPQMNHVMHIEMSTPFTSSAIFPFPLPACICSLIWNVSQFLLMAKEEKWILKALHRQGGTACHAHKPHPQTTPKPLATPTSPCCSPSPPASPLPQVHPRLSELVTLPSQFSSPLNAFIN